MYHVYKVATFKVKLARQKFRTNSLWIASWQRYSHPNKKPLLHAGSLEPWLLDPTGCLKGFSWHCKSKLQRSSPCTISCELTAASSQ
jgi:hypothetical protein